MRYFAYGSNMDPRQMRVRCPSSRALGRALLEDHALRFTRWSPRRACGVADVVPSPGDTVWGVVYELDDDDGTRLDGFEGFVPGRDGNGYRRVDRSVLVDGDGHRRVGVMTYEVCERSTDRLLPSAAYLRHLLDGAEHWGLPAEYLATLRAIPVARDDGH